MVLHYGGPAPRSDPHLISPELPRLPFVEVRVDHLGSRVLRPFPAGCIVLLLEILPVKPVHPALRALTHARATSIVCSMQDVAAKVYMASKATRKHADNNQYWFMHAAEVEEPMLLVLVGTKTAPSSSPLDNAADEAKRLGPGDGQGH